MKKKKRETKRTRCWAEVFVILGLLSVILVNSLYLDGYLCYEKAYEWETLIAGSNGYTAENNTFHYTGNEQSYVQIYSMEGIDQLMLAFGEPAAEDIHIVVKYMDPAGNISDMISEGTWKKGKYTAKIDMEAGQYNFYYLMIPSDFTLNKAYYATEHGYGSHSKIKWMFAAFVMVMILTVIIMRIDKTSALVGKMDQTVTGWLINLWKNKKEIRKKAVFYVGILLLTVLAAYLGTLSGKYVFSAKVFWLAVFLGGILGMFVVNYRQMSERIEWIGFFVILLTGAMFAFLSPANVGVGWDDEIHFRNAVQISHILDNKISAADLAIIHDYTDVALEKRYYAREDQERYTEILDDLQEARYYSEIGDFSTKNTWIAYVPSAIGLLAGRGLGLSFYATLALGRWMNTLLLAALCYWAMKKLKTGKIVVLLIALLPTNIFISGSYSYDTWLTGWSILGLSAFFGEWQRPEKKIDKLTPWLIGVSMYLAVLPKQVYFPLTFIALFLPMSKFQNKKECWKYRCILLAAAFLPFIAVYLQNIAGNGMGKGDVRGGEAVDASSQMDFIRNNPMRAGKILLLFLKHYLNPLSQGPEYITKMGYWGYSPINARILLGTMVAGALVSREEGETRFPWWTKLGVLVVYCGIGFIVAFSMYVAFTGIGAESVAGCQGRYLIPALFPLLYVCTRFPFKTRVKNVLREANIHIALIGIMVFASLWGLWTGCLALY